MTLKLAMLSILFTTGCGPDSSVPTVRKATENHRWLGQGGGFTQWARSGSRIYAISVEPNLLECWEWQNGRLAKGLTKRVDGYMHVALGARDEIFFTHPGRDDRIGILRLSRNDPDDPFIFPIPEGWWCDQIHSSQSDQYIAVGLREYTGENSPSDRVKNRPREMIGLIAPGASEIKWVGTLGGKEYVANNIRRLIPSDDGAYVAAAGWDNGLALLDCSTGKQLWWTRPPNEVSCYYAAFAPDNKVIYTGGGEGCVYGLDVQTGKVVSQWYASESGTSEYGHRISDIAVSPDGKWVAAGTGPAGLVWIFDVQQGKAACILEHGGSTVLVVAFSPDSKAVASFVPGMLKVWDVTQWASPAAADKP